MIKAGLFVGTHQNFIAEGGIGRYMRSLDKYLAAGKHKGFSINRIESPIGSESVPKTLLWSMLSRISSYDLIHVLGPLPLFQLLSKRHKNTIITTAHDFMPTSLIAANIKSAHQRILQKALADFRISLNSDYLISISTQTRDEAVELGFERSRIKVINYGLDSRFFTTIKKRDPQKTFKVGYIGSFPVRKNVRFAIGAFRKIEDTNISFDLYARKDMEYSNLAEQSGNDRRIRFMGSLEEDKVPSTYDKFDLSVFPSIHEGFGLPIIEAQSRGLPVVICRDSHIPKEVRKMCFEAKDEDHMAQIIMQIKENGFEVKRKKATIEYARSFTWKKNIESTISFYKQALQK
ncbi:MAG: glycosyltransferase family 4 protein [Candidatus Micrarchaeota archaeon]|nr:glycosyltransferase family 4 protein [Candidatus Micrarchaeota archaeon]MDE1847559.1 glycosyltransferase family 4 protein [Candidatus Micrarchaeota archaeon]MDE1864276.1 glycosyltransferase family 4 protein [Candidatus Micrarchaeota archaeon]